MDFTNRSRRPRPTSLLLLLAAVLAAGLLLGACGSGSSSNTDSSSEAAETTTGGSTETSTETESGGDPETTVYAEGVPTLEELYEGSEEEPPTTGPKAVPNKKVAVISSGEEAVGARIPTEAFIEASKKLGWQTVRLDGKLNVNEGWAEAIRAGTASNPDAMVLIGISCPEAKTALQEVKAANIPLVSYFGIDCGPGEELWTFPQPFNKKTKGTTEAWELSGETQAAYVVDATEGKAKILETSYLGLFGQAITRGWDKVLAKCSECEVLDDIEWEAAESAPGGLVYQRFETALTKYPEANAVLFPFDNVAAAGMSKAISDSGNSDNITAVAAEGSPETLLLIEEEKGLNAEGAAYSRGWTTWGLADNLNRYFSGEPTASPGAGYTVITKDKNLPPKGQAYETSVDYKGAYEKIWAGK